MKRLGFPLWPRRPSSAQTAKDRLQILLAHERSGATPDYLPQLQREILEVIRRHVKIDDDAIDIRMDQGKELSSLEINIELPHTRP
ncbi:cell division topological specificity factor [Defluviimonas sp. 20V17]|uniref:Cell division topological specificity factor n=1 Tax=Allgaiera indica TaxID=765699 RepID=A0AAN4UNN4_9RHOB|nr:cell division topological specificity factor MinE [Allgaiera indica]KDB03959.1 cell division topological specificity factor [Defluviimonas sp. 20V17]GHD99306.1 cell division topological specificity factor [Allgaiera indica]SDW29107.1 cell division topological specificity factor MinE [Allgaiera indica]